MIIFKEIFDENRFKNNQDKHQILNSSFCHYYIFNKKLLNYQYYKYYCQYNNYNYYIIFAQFQFILILQLNYSLLKLGQPSSMNSHYSNYQQQKQQLTMKQKQKEIKPKTTRFKISDMYYLEIGRLYANQAIEDIKQDLQAYHGIKVQRTTTDAYLYLLCANGKTQDIQNNQSFYAQYQNYELQVNTNRNKMQILQIKTCTCRYYVKFHIQLSSYGKAYRLEDYKFNYCQSCYCSDKASFYRKRRFLTLNKAAIFKIVARLRSLKKDYINPKQVYEILCKQFNINIGFLEQGVKSEDCKRSLRKKFDNFVADAKKAKLNPKKYLTEEQYYGLYLKQWQQIQREQPLEIYDNYNDYNQSSNQQIDLIQQNKMVKLQPNKQISVISKENNNNLNNTNKKNQNSKNLKTNESQLPMK